MQITDIWGSGWFLFLPAGKCGRDVGNRGIRPPNDPKVQRSSPSARRNGFRRQMAKLVNQVPSSCGLRPIRLTSGSFPTAFQKHNPDAARAFDRQRRGKKEEEMEGSWMRAPRDASLSQSHPARDTGKCTNRWRVCVCV